MSNFMRNCVIEMEIADINLSLLSMPRKKGNEKEDHKIAIRKRKKFC